MAMLTFRRTLCYHCNTPFDESSARWCDCILRSHSLVCPECGLCSCDAPLQWKVRFGTYTMRRLSDERVDSSAGQIVEGDSRPLVLIVDDQVIVQTLTREGLTPEFRVITARDGVEGFEMAKAHHPDIVITDALMPKLDGRELCRNLKLYPPTSDIKVVVMSALYHGARHEHAARPEFGADAFLRKPVAIALLRETVQSGLEAASQAATEHVHRNVGSNHQHVREAGCKQHGTRQ